MNIVFTIILVGLIVMLMMRMLPVKGVRNIQANEVNALLADRQKQFIDVRTVGEYKQHHIPSFQNIPLHELNKKLSKLDPAKETVVICQSGMRSNRAVRILKKAGFRQLIHAKNGMNGYRGN